MTKILVKVYIIIQDRNHDKANSPIKKKEERSENMEEYVGRFNLYDTV